MLPDTKKWTQSLTIWSVIVMLLPALARLFGYDLTADDASAISTHIVAIVQAIAGVLAIYGRIRASKAIGAVR